MPGRASACSWTATTWVARLGEAKRQGHLETELKRLALILVDEIGYIPFDPEAVNVMFALVSRRSADACVRA
jgi:DNA replication protein DnaC